MVFRMIVKIIYKLFDIYERYYFIGWVFSDGFKNNDFLVNFGVIMGIIFCVE